MGRITETVKVLIIINVLFFVGTVTLGDTAHRLFTLFFLMNPGFQYWQIITHMFMHWSIMHILFNMLGLYMFGSPLEQMWGRNKFLFFYFSCGVGAFLLSVGIDYYNFDSLINSLVEAGYSKFDVISTLQDGKYNIGWPEAIGQESFQNLLDIYKQRSAGASGAVMGLLVAFGLSFPNTSLMLIFLPIPIKAKYFIPALLAYEIISGFIGGASLFGMNIGHWAHVGGALFGFLMAYYWKKNSFNNKRWN